MSEKKESEITTVDVFNEKMYQQMSLRFKNGKFGVKELNKIETNIDIVIKNVQHEVISIWKNQSEIIEQTGDKEFKITNEILRAAYLQAVKRIKEDIAEKTETVSEQ